MERERRYSWGKNLKLASMFSLAMATAWEENPQATTSFRVLESPISTTPITMEISRLSSLEPALVLTPIPEPEGKLKGRVICLDPGHDSIFVPGASARDERGRVIFDEHELTYAVATILGRLLESEGATVCMTRNSEGFLQIEPYDFNGNGTVTRPEDMVERAQPRIDWMNRHKPDLVLSIHFNGFGDSRVRGTEVYYSDTGPNKDSNKEFAQNVLLSLVDQLREAGFETVDRGIRSDKYKTEYLEQAHWYGFDQSCEDCKRLLTLGNNPMSPRKGSWQTGALVEVVFLSNPQDVAFLQREDALDVIAEGLLQGILKHAK